MTRPLTDKEFKSIGEPKEWGVLPVRPMGATIRMTKDRRILIRNTAEVHNPYKMSQSNLKKRSLKQRIGIKKDFHNCQMILFNQLGQVLFQELETVLKFLKKFGTLFGEQIAIKASKEHSKEIETIEATK